MTRRTACSGSVQRSGATLRYQVEGDGIPVLVVGSAVYYPRTFSRPLRERCALAFADLRHFAQRAAGSVRDDVSFEAYAEDIEALRSAIGFDRAVVVGHSHPGGVALEYAKRYPERVTHLVLVGTPPVGLEQTEAAGAAYWSEHASPERKDLLLRNRTALDASAAADSAEAFVERYVADGPRYWHDAHFDAAHLWDGVPVDMAETSAFQRLFADYVLTFDPERMPAPVLVLTGRHDYVVPPTLCDPLLPHLPGTTYHQFEESGHTPQLEQQERFDEVLLDWLERGSTR
jgi:proline iminopeptidase